MTTHHDPTPPAHRETPPPAHDLVLTEDEYQKKKAELEKQLAVLEAAHVASVPYPSWRYHATEPAQVVGSPAEAEALGAGWSETPVVPPEPKSR
jgi:hypothetical protein